MRKGGRDLGATAVDQDKAGAAFGAERLTAYGPLTASARTLADADEAALAAAAHAFRVLAAPPSVDAGRDADLQQDVRAILAAGGDDVEAALAALAATDAELRLADALPVPASVNEAAALPVPAAVLSTPEGGSGAVLAAGETALLAGGGGGGKSTLALELALHGLAASELGLDAIETPQELRVAPLDAVMLATWEDSLARVGQRRDLLLAAAREGSHVARDARAEGVAWGGVEPVSDTLSGALERGGERLFIQPMTEALYAPPAGQPNASSAPTVAMEALMRRAAGGGARLLVIDPVSAAYAGPPNDAVSVRAFMAALANWSRESGVSVMGIAHDTKSARSELAAHGMGAGAYAVSGSAQWTDASRAVLWLALPEAVAKKNDDEREHRERERERGQRLRVLRLEKANYGPSGWASDLGARRLATGGWAGFAASPAAPARMVA